MYDPIRHEIVYAGGVVEVGPFPYVTTYNTSTWTLARCPLDFDRSSGVAVLDVFAFLNAWLSQDLRADFDIDNAVTISDLFEYINAWLAGC